jgi:hypothetical protein
MTDDERRSFAAPPATGEFDGIDLAFLDPNDEDDQRVLIPARGSAARKVRSSTSRPRSRSRSLPD